MKVRLEKLTIGMILVLVLGFILRDLPFIRYGFLYGGDSLGHFWLSKIIIDTGRVIPTSAVISYLGDAGWFSGYVGYFGFHLIESILSLVTGIELETLFLNLVAVVSFLTIMPIYLVTRKQTENKYYKYSLIILASLWFYFIFYSFIGTYETIGFLYFVFVVYLIEKRVETENAGKILVFLLLTVLPITLIKEEKRFLIYLAYLCSLIFLIGILLERIGLPYLGLYQLRYALLSMPLICFALGYLQHKFKLKKIIMNLVITLIYYLKNKMIIVIFIYILLIFTIYLFGDLLPTIHYAFGSVLILEYFVFTLPIFIILIKQFISKLGIYRNEGFYVCFLGASFLLLCLLPTHEFLIVRALGFISLFLILFIATYGDNKRRLLVILVACFLAIVPAIPSYFYSEYVDRPYYPITKEDADLSRTLARFNITPNDPTLNQLQYVYGCYQQNNTIGNVTWQGDEIIASVGDDVIYSRKGT
jgi:hypothetical protein